MEHEAAKCLNEWIAAELIRLEGRLQPPLIWRRYSEDIQAAWELMQKVWEMDEDATIWKDTVGLGWNYDCPDTSIEGPTFPLRACRAFLWLKNQQQN